MALCSIFCCYVAVAQETTLRHFGVNDGLPSATIYTLIQDKQGFLWFGTPDGVSRFDGEKFTNYTLYDGLGENEILRIAQDSKGRIWFLGITGALSYYLNGKFHNPGNDSVLAKLPHRSSLHYFYEDSKHNLWFTSLAGYLKMDTSGNFSYINGVEAKTESFGGIVYENAQKQIKFMTYFNSSFTHLGDSCVLYVSDKGIFKLCDTASERQFPSLFQASKSTNSYCVSKADLYFLYYDNNGGLWLATGGKGVFYYDYFNSAKPPVQYLDGEATSGVVRDHEGNTWISTLNNGIYMMESWKGISKQYNRENSIVDNFVYSVAKDKDGVVYAGMNAGKVVVIDSNGARLYWKSSMGSLYNRVVKILARGGDLFFGTDIGLEIYHKSINKSDYVIYESSVDSQLKRQFALKDMSFYKRGIAMTMSYQVAQDSTVFDNAETPKKLIALDYDYVRKYAIFANKKQELWYSTAKGVFVYNDHKSRQETKVSAYTTEKISSIGETSDSTMIFATYGQGVLFFKNGAITCKLTQENGLSSNICKRVYVNGANVYIATAFGVTRCLFEHGKISALKVYTTANGLASNAVNDVYADDSEICVATSRGLTILNARAANSIAVAPALYITDISCNSKSLSPDSGSALTYDRNSLHFNFIAIAYRAANSVHYQYRLNDDQPWLETQNTAVDFPYLPPGNYRFQVRARILDGPWCLPVGYSFTILTPFWKTIWFAAFCVVGLLVVVVSALRYRNKVVNRKRNDELKLKDQIINLEQQALQTMMNPHFIFNVMNSIQHSINNSDKHEANLYLSNFARLIRMNLDISSKRYIPIDEEVAYLQLYLTMESFRFGDRLTFDIDVSDEIDGDETLIPVMLLQPFIENAIWHGILPMSESGHVQVTIEKSGEDMLKVTIIDNGIGMKRSKEGADVNIKSHISKGMKMTEQRLDLIGKMSGQALSLKIGDAYPDRVNKGARVELWLPAHLV